MLVQNLRFPLHRVASHQLRAASTVFTRSMSLSGIKSFAEKDRAAEQSEFRAEVFLKTGSGPSSQPSFSSPLLLEILIRWHLVCACSLFQQGGGASSSQSAQENEGIHPFSKSILPNVFSIFGGL
jgi:hypothetical protein